MFNKRPETHIETALERALTKLSEKEVGTAEYAKVLEHVEALHKMKEEEKPKSVSKDAMLGAATNIAGILLIINYERLNPLTSKAMSLVGRK